MKKRFKDIITTTIGSLIMISGLLSYILGMFGIIDEISTYTICIIEFLGWVFVSAKDSLLEGISLNLLNLKKNEG